MVWSNMYVYFVGPMMGSSLASALYLFLFLGKTNVYNLIRNQNDSLLNRDLVN